jgi:hypothetical protein
MNHKTAACLLLSLAAQPGWAFYCGHDLVLEGDYKLQVLQKCGPPTYSQNRVEFRSVLLRGSGIQQPGLDIVNQVQVNIEEWTYDFGPHRFMQALYFENDRLLRTKDLDYGTANGYER